jgi:hypothetical protein
MVLTDHAANNNNMLHEDLVREAIGLASAGLVSLLTVPALVDAWRTNSRFGFGRRGGYVQLGGEGEGGGEGDGYEDRDGFATEDSIRAYTDTRPRIAAWLGTATGLGACIATRILALKSAGHGDVFSELSAWAELACWVSSGGHWIDCLAAASEDEPREPRN